MENIEKKKENNETRSRKDRIIEVYNQVVREDNRVYVEEQHDLDHYFKRLNCDKKTQEMLFKEVINDDCDLYFYNGQLYRFIRIINAEVFVKDSSGERKYVIQEKIGNRIRGLAEKIKKGENPNDAFKRFLEEELGIKDPSKVSYKITSGKRLWSYDFRSDDKKEYPDLVPDRKKYPGIITIGETEAHAEVYIPEELMEKIKNKKGTTKLVFIKLEH